MTTSPRGLRLLEAEEGFVDHIYDDGTGVSTIGFGTTSADVSPLPRTITRAGAEALLRRELAIRYEPPIRALPCKINQNQFDALVSIAYNCGPGIVGTGYQLGRDLHAGNLAAAARDFALYVYAGGRILPGLVARRHGEQALFLTPVGPPPPPPDPEHYLFFAPGQERDAVIEYDRLRPHYHLHEPWIHHLEREITVHRKLVWRAACLDARGNLLPPARRQWNVRHRGWRWQQLNMRSRGDLIVR